jgi:hypothetical protein
MVTPSLNSLGRSPSRAHRIVDLARRHPLWTVAIAASMTRLVAVIALGPLRDGVAVPDEAQYLGLAASVAAGRGAEAWQPGYGASLYDSTATFMAPLTALTWLFGPHQISGQLLAAVFGVVTAVLTVALARRVVRPGVAVLAGLLVAVLPSQVYWSSVVLRESMVWTALALIALTLTAATAARSDRRLVLLGVVGFAALLALCHLRQQTAIVAAWALVLACLVVPSRHRVLLPVGALVLAVVTPLLAGLGAGGYTFVETSIPQLARIRANLSLGAATSIVHTTPVPSSAGSTGTEVTDAKGQRFRVDETGAGASLSGLPSGLLAVTVRPYPWEPAGNTSVRMAKVENVGWLLLYALAIVGAVAGRRRRDVLAFPVIATGAILLTAAVTQGNLGTAFRHRGQVLWALALLAAIAFQRLADRRRPAAP